MNEPCGTLHCEWTLLNRIAFTSAKIPQRVNLKGHLPVGRTTTKFSSHLISFRESHPPPRLPFSLPLFLSLRLSRPSPFPPPPSAKPFSDSEQLIVTMRMARWSAACAVGLPRLPAPSIRILPAVSHGWTVRPTDRPTDLIQTPSLPPSHSLLLSFHQSPCRVLFVAVV